MSWDEQRGDGRATGPQNARRSGRIWKTTTCSKTASLSAASSDRPARRTIAPGLILGRFTQERKPVLEALREELRQRKYLPILFDFDKPRSRNTDETITLLARMARFVVADISDAKSVLQELRAIVPDLPSVPVQPIILAMQEEPGMFDFYRNFRSFMNVHRYASQEQLIADLGEKVVHPAELKVLDLQGST
jgi:hypothetical protein